jgi:nicotinate-nucleotide adenylyltransferase
MRIGIFGGTFNPIHNGHINLVNRICEKILLDKIFVIPTKTPPHKISSDLADDESRLEMCRLAFEDNPKAEISDYEIKQGGKSYTILTLQYLKRVYPDDELFLIIGSDMLLTFHEWKDYKEILKLATIVTASRNYEDLDKLKPYAENLKNQGGECIIVDVEPYEISSTQIRSLIKQNKDYTCYLPKKVVEYIACKKLYQ